MCYKPLAVLAIQRDNSEELIGTHQSQSGCNSTGVSSSRLLFKLLNNDDNIVLGFARGLLPFEGHIHKAGGLRSQHLPAMERAVGGEGRGGRRAGSPRHKSADARLSLIGLPRRGSLLGSGKGQPLPSCTPDVGSRLRLIFRLDYLAYLMIFASLLSSIVFTRTAGY